MLLCLMGHPVVAGRMLCKVNEKLPLPTYARKQRGPTSILLPGPLSTMFIYTSTVCNQFNAVGMCSMQVIHKDLLWVPVTTAWRVFRLRMEERPPVMERSCEYIE
jgi:hypothetical protein